MDRFIFPYNQNKLVLVGLPKTGSDYNRLSNFLQKTIISFYHKQGICIKIRRRLLSLIWAELNEKLQALENIVSRQAVVHVMMLNYS